MGVVYNMVGGNGSVVVAFLIANYPSGATCTATCDGKTLTGSGNTQSIFAIPFFGTWRVTITDQGQSAFEDVVVSDNLQYTVSLSFGLYIVKDGVLQSGYVGGNTQVSQQTGYVQVIGPSSGTARWTSIGPVQDIDYTYLVCEMSDEYLDSQCTWGIAHSATTTTGTWPLQVLTGEYSGQTVKIYTDVSAVDFTVARYVGFGLRYTSRNMHITNLYFTNTAPT